MTKATGQVSKLTEGQAQDLQELRQLGYVYVAKNNDYVVCFAETAMSLIRSSLGGQVKP